MIPMKIEILTRVLLLTLAVTLEPWRGTAQTFTTLHSFTGGSDGAFASTVLVSGDTIYGTTPAGGTNDSGTVFALKTDGMGFTTLHTFSLLDTNSSGIYTNGDGALSLPSEEFVDAGLVLSEGILYGTAQYGGPNGYGTVFSLQTDGTGFTTLCSFSLDTASANAGPAGPSGALVLSGGMLYGTSILGGTNFQGTVFSVKTSGTDLTTLHSFNFDDGANPTSALVLSGNTLYGTAPNGGTDGFGVVFALNTNGSAFTQLFDFGGPIDTTNGSVLQGNLLLSGDTLYGATFEAGKTPDSSGTIFAVSTNGMNFTTLYNFSPYYYNSTVGGDTNSDGAEPNGGLALFGDMLYGTTAGGGTNGAGAVFAVNTNGTVFTTVHAFSSGLYFTNSDGGRPFAGLVLSGNTLYGATAAGGMYGEGTVFAINLGPVAMALTSHVSGQNLVLSWTNPALSLLTAPTLKSHWTPVSGAASPYTVAMTNTAQFFCLRSQTNP
jgi:uncharacterized repeat protein (TIGR03803 family)